eukprot:4720906-Amphidinium_carterae.1
MVMQSNRLPNRELSPKLNIPKSCNRSGTTVRGRIQPDAMCFLLSRASARARAHQRWPNSAFNSRYNLRGCIVAVTEVPFQHTVARASLAPWREPVTGSMPPMPKQPLVVLQ